MATDLIHEVEAGENISTAITDAHGIAIQAGRVVRFNFNGVMVRVGPESGGEQYRERVCREWNRGLLRPENSFVTNPCPPVMLSAEQIAEDEELRAAAARSQAAVTAKVEAETERKRIALRAALKDAPPLSIRDKALWDKCIANNPDPYGSRVNRYAEDWGRLMQVAIANGEAVADCADRMSHVADDDGITGFMHGAAVATLIGVWEHGDELRAWRDRQ